MLKILAVFLLLASGNTDKPKAIMPDSWDGGTVAFTVIWHADEDVDVSVTIEYK